MRCLISTGSPASGTDLVAPPNESPMGFQASGRERRGRACDSMRPLAVSQAQQSESFFESLSCRSPCFAEEFGDSDESYSGSYATHVSSGTKRQEVAKSSASRRFYMVSAVSHATVAPVTHTLDPPWTPEDWVRIPRQSKMKTPDAESGVVHQCVSTNEKE